METLRYGQNKILGVIAACGLSAALFLWILLNPHAVEDIPRARIFATDLGHYALAPFLVLLCTCVAWRGALMLVGDRKAAEATPDALVLTTWWRSRKVRWADLGHVEIGTYGARRYKGYQLVVHYRSGALFGSSTAKLPLGTTELHPNRYQDFVDTLNALRERRGGFVPERPAAPPPGPPLVPGDSGFDADAALARYMAKKAAGQIDAPVPRPVFGRKRA